MPRAASDYLQQAAVLVARMDIECGGTEGNAACHPAVVYVATDSADAVRLARAWETGQNRLPSIGFAPGRRVRVVAASDTETQVRGLSLSLSLCVSPCHLSLLASRFSLIFSLFGCYACAVSMVRGMGQHRTRVLDFFKTENGCDA